MRRAKKVPKTSSRQDDRPDAFFTSYKDPLEDCIGPEGVEKLCKDLQLDPADRKVLLLAWKMGAQRMGFFSKAEFALGLRNLDAHDIASLKTGLSQTAIRVDNDTDAFQDFYQFAFKFCLTQTEYKFINNDQWMGFFRFNEEVAPDCSDYDESQAWPLLLDNYVEFRRS